MAGPATGKVCGLCGADCSNKPRTKDQSGKYFCKECYEQALARKRGHGELESHRPTAADARRSQRMAAPRGDDDFGMLNELLAQQNSDIVVAAGATRACSNCGAPMADGAVICVSCGFNSQSGKAMNVSVKKAPREPILGGWLGPFILGGILSLVSLGVGTLLYGSEGAFGVLSVLFLFGTLSWWVWTVFESRRVEGAQVKAWLIPGYAVFYALGISESRYLRAYTIGVVITVIMFFINGYEWERKHPSNRDGFSHSSTP